MSFAAVESIARAVLYEGYLLYPYRHSAVKNHQRWLFGRILPRDYGLAHDPSEPWQIGTECLLVENHAATLEIRVSFLQPTGDGDAVERVVQFSARLADVVELPRQTQFSFDPQLSGTVTLSAVRVVSDVYRITLVVENLTPGNEGQSPEEVLLHGLVSTHAILSTEGGALVSLIDPPDHLRSLAADCRHLGLWPVLVGPKSGAMLLAAPIILSDYPQVAPESPGDFFDGTEIDEMLLLRIQTLTDEEKREMSSAGPRVRDLLEQTESLGSEQRMQLHGRLRGATPGDRFQIGDRVRLRPRRRADAFDFILEGQTATIVAIETDLEDRVHLGVVVEADPAPDFGAQGLPGHRFFFGPEDVERL